MRKRSIAFVLAATMLATILPTTAVQAAEVEQGTNMIENGTFDSDLHGWTDAVGTIAVDSQRMKITLNGTETAHIRTDMAISAGTSCTMGFDAETSDGTEVKATVYEYSFDNKILEKHIATAQEPITFTTSDAADTLGVVLCASGAAGDVYVDNVQVIANEKGIITDNPNDVNNSGSDGADDVVHMKKALANGISMNLQKYADRNGDGRFDDRDVSVLRERLIGKSKDDSTATNATDSAIGVKLAPVIPENTPIQTGSGLIVGETTGKVKLSTTNDVSTNYYPYMMTESEYGEEHFEFTVELEEGAAPNLMIGARINDPANYMYSMGGNKEGIVIRLFDFYFNIKAPGYWGTAINTSAHYKNESTYLGGTCKFEVDVKKEDDKDMLYIAVTKNGEQICNKSFDVTGNVPDTGKFVIWSMKQESPVIDYCIGQPVEDAEDRSTAYFTTGGAYTGETFVFETDMTYTDTDKLYVGVRVNGTVERNMNAVEGLTISFHADEANTYVQTYAPTAANASIAAKTFVLKGNEAYKFFLKVTDESDNTKTLHFSAYQNGEYVASFNHTYTAEESALIPSSGAFAIWSTGVCRDVLYYTMPDYPMPGVTVDLNGDADAVEIGVPENAGGYDYGYLALKGDYKSEHFTFTTTVKDPANPNLLLGSRMQGVNKNYALEDGIAYKFYDGFYECYFIQDGQLTWIGAKSTSFASNTTYQFDVSTVSASDSTSVSLIIRDMSGNVVHNATLTTGLAIPESGNFMVWTKEVREIAYKMPYKEIDHTNIKVEADEKAGTAAVQTGESGFGALGIIGDYTEEYFEFTTVITDSSAPNLVIGVHVSDDYSTSPTTAEKGLLIDLYDTFYQMYYNTWGNNVQAHNYGDEGAWSSKNPFVNGEAYTFGVKIYEESGTNYLTFTIRQGDTLIYKYTKCGLTNEALPESGSFVVWTKEARSISYEMPKKVTVGTSLKIAATEDSGSAKALKTSITNYGNANSLEMTGPYTKESFTFTTKVTTGNEEGHMVVGARVAAPDAYWLSSGNGLFIRLGSQKFDVYYNGANNLVWHRAYDGGKSLTVGENCTVTVTVDESNLVFHVEQENGMDSTNTVSIADLGIPGEGAFAVWKLDTHFDIDYNVTPTEPTDVPDYSASTMALDMYAHIGPSNGIYTDESGTWHSDGTDYQTAEEYTRYKECGFDSILMHGNDAYMSSQYYIDKGQTDANNRWYLEAKLEACRGAGLKLIVFDTFIHDLAASETALVGVGCKYATDAELETDLRASMAFYYQDSYQDVFKGIALVDEPTHKMFAAHADVIRVLQKIAKEDERDIYIHTVLLPFNGTKSSFYEKYTGEKYNFITGMFTNMKNAYATYVSDYLNMVPDSVFSFDVYPILTDSPYVAKEYFYNLQHTVNAAAATNKDVHVTIQSMGNTTSKNADPTEADIRFQLNAALGFGVKDIRYYTYWAFPDYSLGYRSSIVDKEGNSVIYEQVKSANADARKLAKVILNFDYVKTAVEGSASGFDQLTTEELDNVTITSASVGTIVNQMQDETNSRTGYMVLNATCPSTGVEDTVKLTFNGYDFATCYVNGEATTKALINGVLPLTIPAGEGVFVIPHN